MKRTTALLAVAAVILAYSSRAQPGVQQVDQAQQRRNVARTFAEGESAPELYPAESSDVGPQSVLQIKRRHTLFEATADVQYFYTDNAFLTENDRHGVDMLVSTVEFALAPSAYDLAGGSFSPRLGYQHQWFNFSLANHGRRVPAVQFDPLSIGSIRIDAFDFNAQTLFVDGRWTRDNWIWEAGFDFRRLMTSSAYDEFYKEYVPRWGLQRLFPLNNTMAFSAGYSGDYRFAEPHDMILRNGPTTTVIPSDTGDRTDHALTLAYVQTLCSHTSIQPYYQIKYTHFTDPAFGTRNDLLNTFGAAIYWTVCPNFEIRTFADYNIRSSDNSAVSEYRQFDVGGGVNLVIRF